NSTLVCSQPLAAGETENTDVTDGTGWLPLPAGSKRLCCILNHVGPDPATDLQHRIEISDQTADVRGDNAKRVTIAARFQCLPIEVEAIGPDVAWANVEPGTRHCQRYQRASVPGYHHCLSGTQSFESLQGNEQPGSAGALDLYGWHSKKFSEGSIKS